MSNQQLISSRGYGNDNERRKRSFVIIGLPEFHVYSQRAEQDLSAAIDIVRYLGVEDTISPRHVRRLGNPSYSQRPLIVELPTIQARDTILQRRHFLRRNFNTSDIRLYAAYTDETDPRLPRSTGNQSYAPTIRPNHDQMLNPRSTPFNNQYDERDRRSDYRQSHESPTTDRYRSNSNNHGPNTSRTPYDPQYDYNSGEPGPSSSRRNYPSSRS